MLKMLFAGQRALMEPMLSEYASPVRRAHGRHVVAHPDRARVGEAGDLHPRGHAIELEQRHIGGQARRRRPAPPPPSRR
jgi:hypothetical protein